MFLRFFFVFLIILADILVSIYVPKFAMNLLEASVQNAIIWGVVWYSLLRFLNESTKYILELVSFPVINKLIQNIQFQLCQKWHTQQTTLKEGELLTYFRRIGFAIRTFYRHGILNFIPALYKLLIATIVFYQIHFIDTLEALLILATMLLPAFWLVDYFKTRVKSWEVTDQTGRVIHEFLHQKNWNALYQKNLEQYLSNQLTIENRTWSINNIARNVFLLKKEICVAVLSMVIFGSALLKADFDKGNFLFIQTHFINVLVAFNAFFTSILFVSESWAEFRKIYQFLKKPSVFAHIQHSKDIILKDITFAYPSNEAVLNDFNLTIKAGEKILLKGENGIGKSTLIRLLSGELKPQHGTIKRPQSFVVIEQEPTLLTETLFFHLTFALPQQPPMIDLLKALKKAHINIEDMPFDRIMSDEISMGEKIKILIARALLEKPDVLILDESLKSLPKNEADDILKTILKAVSIVIVASHQSDEGKFTNVVDLSN